MTDAAEDIVRTRGRPQARPDDETLHLIAEAARSEFTVHGYAGTNVDAVARCAGVSKKTLYRLVPGKADLFRASVSDRIRTFLLAVDMDEFESLDAETGLAKLLQEFGNLTLSASTIAIQKLVLSESERFPELAQTFYAEAISTTRKVLTEFLERRRERGEVDVDDPPLAAGILRGMMLGEPQQAVMMGLRAAPTSEEIAERAQVCARLFLRGCLPKQRASGS